MQRIIKSITLFLLLVMMVTPCLADGDAHWLQTMEEVSDVVEEKHESLTDRIVIAPVPMVNPTLDAGLVGVGMYMHPEDDFWNDDAREDNATRQSITGLAAMGTTNRSWAAGVFHKGFYANDRFRGTAYLAYGDFNLKFYGIGDDSILRDHPIQYSAKITAFQPEFLMRVAENLYVGPKYSIFNWNLGIDLSKLHPLLPKLNRSFTTAGLGLAGEWDTTDHSVYATKGGKFEFSAMDYNDTWGGDFDYAKLESNYNHYFGLTEKLLFAVRGDLNLSTGSTPFFDLPFLHMRGFPYARYIDKQSSSIQGELKYKLTKKWGLSLFGGVGWIASTPDQLFRKPMIPTVGTGVRYLIAEKEAMYLGMDVAVGPGSKAVYFRVGEWF